MDCHHSALMNSSINESPIERNLKFLAFIPCKTSTPNVECRQQSVYRDVFVQPAIKLAVEYVNTGQQFWLGDEVCALRVNISVDYIESRVSCVINM